MGAQTSLGNVNNFSDSYTYTSLDGFLKFNLSSGSLIPSLIGGYGFSQFADGLERPGIFPSSETSRTIFGGLGFSFYLSDNLAINLQSTYRSMNENDGFDHLQHNVGLSLGFGSGDADKDGVPDSKDKCPDVAGLKEYEGCPDTDGDTIIDKDDKCPNTAGVSSNNGCPEPTKEIMERLNAVGAMIPFQLNRAELGAEVKGLLGEVLGIMNNYSKTSFMIEGHTDSSGPKSFNPVSYTHLTLPTILLV